MQHAVPACSCPKRSPRRRRAGKRGARQLASSPHQPSFCRERDHRGILSLPLGPAPPPGQGAPRENPTSRGFGVLHARSRTTSTPEASSSAGSDARRRPKSLVSSPQTLRWLSAGEEVRGMLSSSASKGRYELLLLF